MTFVTSIPAMALYKTVLRHPVSYIAGAGHDTQVLLGALLELLLIIANVGTAVVIFPIVRRAEQGAGARLRDRAAGSSRRFILVGILCMLGIITLHTNRFAGANEGTVAYSSPRSRTGRSCSARAGLSSWGNGLILGYLMYQLRNSCRDDGAGSASSGGPLIIITGTAVMFTGNEPSHALHSLQAILSIPEIAWELFLGIYCTIWGFRRDAPILSGTAPDLSGSDAVVAVSPA